MLFLWEKIKLKMARLINKKLLNEKSDTSITRESVKNISQLNRNEAKKELKKLFVTEKEKIDSGEYEWVTIQPKYGASYKSLHKKKNG